mmetsp:Transcript_21500/g.71249  ORF Transcript_21500/g.71249 Transcript_21500/m.71249 type:complete len:111 (+) Transcript_21500:1861-2193(+)
MLTLKVKEDSEPELLSELLLLRTNSGFRSESETLLSSENLKDELEFEINPLGVERKEQFLRKSSDITSNETESSASSSPWVKETIVMMSFFRDDITSSSTLCDKMIRILS